MQLLQRLGQAHPPQRPARKNQTGAVASGSRQGHPSLVRHAAWRYGHDDLCRSRTCAHEVRRGAAAGAVFKLALAAAFGTFDCSMVPPRLGLQSHRAQSLSPLRKRRRVLSADSGIEETVFDVTANLLTQRHEDTKIGLHEKLNG